MPEYIHEHWLSSKMCREVLGFSRKHCERIFKRIPTRCGVSRKDLEKLLYFIKNMPTWATFSDKFGYSHRQSGQKFIQRICSKLSPHVDFQREGWRQRHGKRIPSVLFQNVSGYIDGFPVECFTPKRDSHRFFNGKYNRSVLACQWICDVEGVGIWFSGPHSGFKHDSMRNTIPLFFQESSCLETRDTKDVIITLLSRSRNREEESTMKINYSSTTFKLFIGPKQNIPLDSLNVWVCSTEECECTFEKICWANCLSWQLISTTLPTLTKESEKLFAGGATLEEVLGIQVRAPIQAPATAARDDRNDTRGRTVRKVRSRALRRRIRYQQQRFNYCQSCGKAGVIIECDFCTFSYHRLAPPMPFDYASTAKHMFSCYALWKPRRLYFDFLV
eukprot:TRINITY_DN2016_c0_g1_i1.p1 TRINITY_DN2016_c0_g1~~TRINITY_DN2016_c0_g1_i1.p1  ORF type:complete len:389 (-),score=11.80 TRINITY_DN2016_c0_g1_i1:121-1287(-)